MNGGSIPVRRSSPCQECFLVAALLLYRLISLADDQGRLPGHSKYVRATAFPMRDDITERKVARALDELSRAGFVLRYDIGGRWYLQIDRWFDLQGKWGQRRTYPSHHPAPPGWSEDWVTAEGDHDEMRAAGAQIAGDVRPPIPSSFSSSSSLTGPNSAVAHGGGPERLRDLLERSIRGQLTEEDAIEFGTLVAESELAREVSR